MRTPALLWQVSRVSFLFFDNARQQINSDAVRRKLDQGRPEIKNTRPKVGITSTSLLIVHAGLKSRTISPAELIEIPGALAVLPQLARERWQAPAGSVIIPVIWRIGSDSTKEFPVRPKFGPLPGARAIALLRISTLRVALSRTHSTHNRTLYARCLPWLVRLRGWRKIRVEVHVRRDGFSQGEEEIRQRPVRRDIYTLPFKNICPL